MYTLSLVLCALLVLVSSVLVKKCSWYLTWIPYFSLPLINDFFCHFEEFNLWWFIGGAFFGVLPLTTVTHYNYNNKRARLSLCSALTALLNLIYVYLYLFTSPFYVPYSVSGGLLWVIILFLLMEDFHDYITNNYSSYLFNKFSFLSNL